MQLNIRYKGFLNGCLDEIHFAQAIFVTLKY